MKAEAVSGEDWEGAGKEVGLQIWRIEKFKPVVWPKERHGEFFDGDSYIVLNTYKKEKSSDLYYDLHFWIGVESTSDEYGTAAIKAIELDQFLGDKPVQYREKQGQETRKFKNYFDTFMVLNGGVDSGYTKVGKPIYKKRLFKVSGEKRKIEVKEVPCLRENLDSTDVMILDTEEVAYTWIGKKCSPMEKMAAAQHVQKLKSNRPKLNTEVLYEEDLRKGDEFYDRNFTSGAGRRIPDEFKPDPNAKKQLYIVTDESGKTEYKPAALKEPGKIRLSDFNTKDVFIFDNIYTIYVYFGKKASTGERANGLQYGYQRGNAYIELKVVKEGQEDEVEGFKEALDK